MPGTPGRAGAQTADPELEEVSSVNRKMQLTGRANQWLKGHSEIAKVTPLPGPGRQHSDLVEIARRNGEFRRNYGLFLGAFLYLRSLSAARGRSFYGLGLICALMASALPWLAKLGWRMPLPPG